MRFDWKFLLFSVLIAGLLTSCKYEEGPILSLQSRVKRVAGDWDVAYSTNSNGDENTDTYEDLKFSFREDYTAKIEVSTTLGTEEILGTWDFGQDDTRFKMEDLELFGGLVKFDEEFEILRLTQDEFWLRSPEDSLRVLHLEAIVTE